MKTGPKISAPLALWVSIYVLFSDNGFLFNNNTYNNSGLKLFIKISLDTYCIV